LCRFAFELLEYIFHINGTRLLVHYQEDTTPDDELSNDILAINTVFICRLQGRRAAGNRRKRTGNTIDNEQDKSVLQLPTEKDIEEMDRLL
jgi:predicted site-specific integrase-resolvase